MTGHRLYQPDEFALTAHDLEVRAAEALGILEQQLELVDDEGDDNEVHLIDEKFEPAQQTLLETSRRMHEEVTEIEKSQAGIPARQDVPVTTPRRSPSPRRTGAISCETPPPFGSPSPARSGYTPAGAPPSPGGTYLPPGSPNFQVDTFISRLIFFAFVIVIVNFFSIDSKLFSN